MDHADRIAAEEGLAGQVCQPLRRRHELKLSQTCKEGFLFTPIASGEIQKALGVIVALGTMGASGFPFFAVGGVTVSRMACKGPAVVQRPDHALPGTVKIRKKFLKVEIVAVDVVQVNHVRVILVDPFQESAGSRLAAKAAVVQQPCAQRMHLHAHLRADANGVFPGVLRYRFPAVCNFDLMPLGLQRGGKIRADPSRAADSTDRVDHQYFHQTLRIQTI